MTPGFQAPLFLLLLASLQLQASSSTTTPGQHSGTSPTQVPPGHGAITAASTTPRGPEPPAISVFSLSFSIENRHFNSSLEDPGSSYYQELQRNISELTVCQCRRKNCGQLDIFPARDAYHPMSEYPTYHTHGRYMPPGSRRSPYEEVRRERLAGSGGLSHGEEASPCQLSLVPGASWESQGSEEPPPFLAWPFSPGPSK
uniref:Uncharacterized protein n=1 Tax=Neovison vison TaxID=452646 RepID=A0A8C7BLP3_NEOVI